MGLLPPLQATSLYSTMVNGGKLIVPSLIEDKIEETRKLISIETSHELRKILRKVVSSKDGTASLADKNDGYLVGGKTGTAESYSDRKIE